MVSVSVLSLVTQKGASPYTPNSNPSSLYLHPTPLGCYLSSSCPWNINALPFSDFTSSWKGRDFMSTFFAIAIGIAPSYFKRAVCFLKRSSAFPPFFLATLSKKTLKSASVYSADAGGFTILAVLRRASNLVLTYFMVHHLAGSTCMHPS